MIRLGMTFDITVNTKQDGKPFHLLNEEQQEIYELNAQKESNIKEEIYMCGNWEIVKFLKEVSEVLMDDKDQGELFISIDINNIDEILIKLKVKIKTILDSSDIFDDETFGNGSELHKFAQLHKTLNNFHKNQGFKDLYLIGYAGW